MSAADSLRGRRLIFFVEGLELGGAERQVLRLAPALARDGGARVEVWGFLPPGASAEAWERAGLAWRTVRPPFHARRGLVRRRLLRLAWSLRRARPDAILGYGIAPNVAVGLCWRATGARCFVWGQRDAGIDLGLPALERRAARLATRCVSNSEHACAWLEQGLGVPRERIEVIPNGVELDEPRLPRDEWRRRLGADDGTLVVCMLAHLYRRKGHATLLAAWREVLDGLARRGRRGVLALAGRVVEREPLEEAARLGVEASVRFLGPVSDAAGLLAASDVAALSSHSEGSPNAVLEPMAAGLPVVASDLPGIREALGPGHARWLAAPGEAAPLAQALLALADDPGLRAALGAAHRRRIEESFGVERMVERSARLLAGLLEPGAPR